MQVVSVLKNGKVKGRYLINCDFSAAAKNLMSDYKPGYEYVVQSLTDDDFDDKVYEMFWEDDNPKCETCKHEYEPKKEEKISIAEFNGKQYPIPEKRWFLVEKNLSHYQEHEKN